MLKSIVGKLGKMLLPQCDSVNWLSTYSWSEKTDASTIDSITYRHGIGNARRLYMYYPYPGCGFHFETQAKSNYISVYNYT